MLTQTSTPFFLAVSIRNTKNTLFKNLLDVCCSCLSFYVFGYAFLYGGGDSAFIGSDSFALAHSKFEPANATVEALDTTAKSYAEFVYAFAFAATSSTIVSGAVAERFRFKAYAIYSCIITGLVFPLGAHWVWSSNGWASAYKEKPLFGSGAVDYAGSGIVHITGGLAALIACIIVGPRVGRFNAGVAMEMPMQSPVFQTVGTMFLWFGWYGFNCVAPMQIGGGQSFIAARAAVTTTLSAGTGGASVMLVDAYTPKQKITPRRLNNGILCGLVSISGSAGIVEPYFAVIIGAVGGVIYCATSRALLRAQVDDVVDAIPVHLFGGAWGVLASALFVRSSDYALKFREPAQEAAATMPCGLFMGCEMPGSILAANVVLFIALVLWIGFTCTMTLHVIKMTSGGLRVNLDDEMKGIDVSQHGGQSYTEFQTTVFTFKTASGGHHSMEMRVRAGDAAKFAMALSEVMEGSAHESESDRGDSGRSRFSQSSGAMVYMNNTPIRPGALGALAAGGGLSSGGSTPGDRSRGGSGRGGVFAGGADEFAPNVAYMNHSVSAGVSAGHVALDVPAGIAEGGHLNTVSEDSAGSKESGSGSGAGAGVAPRTTATFDPFEEANRQP